MKSLLTPKQLRERRSDARRAFAWARWDLKLKELNYDVERDRHAYNLSLPEAPVFKARSELLKARRKEEAAYDLLLLTEAAMNKTLRKAR